MTVGTPSRPSRRLVAGAAMLTAALPAGCGQGGSADADAVSRLTFGKDVAPIVFEKCAPCHHPGGSAPFSLLAYRDLAKRAEDIVRVTERRYMPPWLPEPGYGEFLGERRLGDDQIRTIRDWVAQGAAQGDPSAVPPAPRLPDAWQLGEPDLVLRVPRPYVLAAGGTDVFRNFVIAAPVAAPRYVRAVEIQPGNKRIVHHANVLVDRAQSLRSRDTADPEIGFEGMDVEIESEQFEPESHFLFWKPGTTSFAEPDDLVWRLDERTDLVLNMHLQPSGKSEQVQPAIGLYFSDRPPTRFPMLLQLEHDGAIDISPGEKTFTITDEYTLPVDVEVLGVYPHAHYLGKDLRGFATLPDGTRKWLIWIKDWDFDWQAVYRYVRPVFLPKGATLSMRWTYDNSAGNPRNPHDPPRRVVAGNRSSDEMGHLWIQVLPRARDDLTALQDTLMRQRLRKYPSDFVAHANLGALLHAAGRMDEAVAHLRRAVGIRPNQPVVRNNLGAALRSMGRLDEAIREFREVVRIRPDYANARYNLGSALLSRGDAAAAVGQFQEFLKLTPDDADAQSDLGSALALQGRSSEARSCFERAIILNPDHPHAHSNLGHVLVTQGKLALAAVHYERALQIDPENADAHNDLGSVRARQGRLTEAAVHFDRALRLNPKHVDARANLGRVRALLAHRRRPRRSRGCTPLRRPGASVARLGRMLDAPLLHL
jgi:Flp pilus assembly protein TadD/mono/diheme cytochrome c family protein